MQVDWWSIITIRSLLRPMLGENQEHRTCSQTRSVVCIVCPGASFRCMTTLGADESQPMGLGASGRYHGVRQGCLVSAQRHDMGQKTLPQTSEKNREPTPPCCQLARPRQGPRESFMHRSILKKPVTCIYRNVKQLSRRHYDYGAAHQGTRAES